MKSYLYTACHIYTQKKVKGEMFSEDLESVRRYLIEQDFYPLKIKAKTLFNKELTFQDRPISLKDTHLFCKQFGMMIKSGMSILQALEICSHQLGRKHLQDHLKVVYEEVYSGKSLSKALASREVFPSLLIRLTMCGELSGQLDQVMEYLSQYIEKQIRIKKSIKKAMSYPCMIALMMVLVIVFLMKYVLPEFIDLAQSFNAELPFPTQTLLKINILLDSYGKILILFMIAIVMLTYYSIKIKRVKEKLNWIGLNLPIVGNFNKKRNISVVLNFLAMLMKSGIPLLEAINEVKNLISNEVIKKELIFIESQLSQGKTFSQIISKSKNYSSIVQGMILIGEEAGTLDEVFLQIYEYLNQEIEETLSRSIALIEPILTIVMGFVVGWIMLAIMLPTFSIAITPI